MLYIFSCGVHSRWRDLDSWWSIESRTGLGRMMFKNNQWWCWTRTGLVHLI